MAHLLILDALNLIRRIHSVQSKQQPDDVAAQLAATDITMQRAVRTILQEANPSHVIAVFDSESPGWRKELYPAYKEGRTAMPEGLRQGLNQLQDSLFKLGIDSLVSETDEADDLIATLTKPLMSHQHQVTLISTDKGFCQLLDQGLQIRDYFNKRWLDHAFVQQQYGLQPAQLVDFWALTGISGMNIKGVAGIGEKTAQQLLTEYGTLMQLLNADSSQNKKVQLVQQNRDVCLLAQQLVRLKDDIPLGFNLRDLRYPPLDKAIC
ncbi:flap endonuclease Xni [Tolumonas lignilytica]|uniref:flap endonuclease Xni n=1 Tax=Tolumonas lignilytica TaxID=1283284 RepID=UPI0004679461|nr:flap endonuclease Xni [Tolumonas lignilytica]